MARYTDDVPHAELLAKIGGRSVVLVGMMGAGKTTIGRRIAQYLSLPFVDSDEEIAKAAQLSIPEIFEKYGEEYFRDGERRVILRLLEGEPKIIATGGGAFMNSQTREAIRAQAISVWLKAELPLLMRRVKKRGNRVPVRPLLLTSNPESVMITLLEERNPVYATADITVLSEDISQDAMVSRSLEALEQFSKNI
jgi:shikimate kinase